MFRCLEFSDPAAESVSVAVKSFLDRHGDGGSIFAALTADLASVFSNYDPRVAGDIVRRIVLPAVTQTLKDKVRFRMNVLLIIV